MSVLMSDASTAGAMSLDVWERIKRPTQELVPALFGDHPFQRYISSGFYQGKELTVLGLAADVDIALVDKTGIVTRRCRQHMAVLKEFKNGIVLGYAELKPLGVPSTDELIMSKFGGCPVDPVYHPPPRGTIAKFGVLYMGVVEEDPATATD